VTVPASTASTRLCNHPIRPDRSADDGHAEGRDSTARFVVTDVPGVGMKGMARFQYEVGKKSKVVKKRNVGNKRGKKRN